MRPPAPGATTGRHYADAEAARRSTGRSRQEDGSVGLVLVPEFGEERVGSINLSLPEVVIPDDAGLALPHGLGHGPKGRVADHRWRLAIAAFEFLDLPTKV